MVVNLLTYLNVLTHCSTTPSACRASPTYRRSSSGPSASRRPSSASLTPTPIPHPNPNPDPNPNPNPNVGQARLQPRLVGAGRGAARSPLRLVQGASRVGGRSRARRRLLLCTLAHRPRGGRAERRRADVRLAPSSPPSFIALHTAHPSRPYTPYTHRTYTPLDRCGSLKFTTKFPHAVLATFVRSFPIVQRLAELSCTALNEAFVCHTGLEPQI